jgi:putative flavoprotein involved in K+ transport
MTESIPSPVPTVVVGAGQAGLALSRCLTARGLRHVVLERGTIAHSWRTQRWDSFTLLSPNWQTRLPGYGYSGPDPHGFLTGPQVVAFFEDYARSFAAPVRCDVAVRRVRPAAEGWLVDTTAGPLSAANVVLATGDLGHPRIPAVAARLPRDLVQRHSSAYRNPAQLPAGPVLVVGAGPSGQQVAAELAAAGRRVHLAVGRHRCLPRRYRGHDAYWWMDRLGMLDRTVDSLPAGRRRSPNAVLAGGVRDLDVRRLVAEGVTAHGRLLAAEGDVLTFAGDLPATLAAAEDNARRFRAAVDAHVATHGLDVPAETVADRGDEPWTTRAPRTLALADLAAVVWATGFGRDHRYVEAPVLDEDGEPVHRRGVTAAAGLYFLGLRWQYRRGRRRRAPRGPHRRPHRRPSGAGRRGVTADVTVDVTGPPPDPGGGLFRRARHAAVAAVPDGPSNARTTATSARIAALSARSRSSTPSRSQS